MRRNWEWAFPFSCILFLRIADVLEFPTKLEMVEKLLYGSSDDLPQGRHHSAIEWYCLVYVIDVE